MSWIAPGEGGRRGRRRRERLERPALCRQEAQEELEQEQSELTHAEEIKRSLLISIGLLSENEPSVAVQIKEALISLANAEKFKPELSKISERLNSALIEIKDLISEIEDFDELDFSSE